MEMIRLDRAQGITTLTLARGKVNALDQAMVERASVHLEALGQDPECRAVILTGQGSFFSFGLDVPALYDLSPEAFTRFLERFTALYLALFELPKPVVAAVNGHAIAGGFMLATACDCRLMAGGRAKIALNEVTFGSTVFAGSIEILRCVTGHRHAETIALSGCMYSAEQALDLGLVDEVVEPQALAGRAFEKASSLGAGDLTAYSDIKRLLRHGIAERIRQSEAESIRRFVEIWYSPRTRERLKAIEIRG